MKIGVVSDTHSCQLPKQMLEDFQNVDLIVHVGDFCCLKDLALLKTIKPVRAVCGNMDEPDIRQEFPERDIFEAEGVRIGLYHGHGSPKQVLEFVKKEFKKDKMDVVIFGHSHHPFNEMIDGVLYFNPGSATDTLRPPFCSYGILKVEEGAATGRIVKIKD